MIKDLIYDFDGTLSDTYPVVTRILLDILREHGVKEDFDRAYGYLKVSYGYAAQQYDIGLDPKVLSRMIGERAAVAALTDEQLPIAGALELLKAAAEKGRRNFIYTHSGEFVHGVIAKWGFAPYVTYTLDSSLPFPRKPDPAALRFLCEKFEIVPETALMIGDRDIDVEVGHNAGMRGCLFDEGGYYPDCRAEYRVKALGEIQKLFEGERI